MSKKTPLYDVHKALGAKFTEFGGWDMPVQYSGIAEEHRAVREACGLFDVSHMGEILVRGPKAEEALQWLTTNDVSKLDIGRAHYSMFLNEKGGVVDDIIVYRLGDEEYFLCVNAANADKDFAWMLKNNPSDAEISNESENYAQLALQGPKAEQILTEQLALSPGELSQDTFRLFSFRRFDDLLVARTGYTGEDGFEIFCAPEHAPSLWNALMEVGKPHGLLPVGLGARDTLRLEASLSLHGHEISDDIDPLTAGLKRYVKLKKGDFLGREALVEKKKAGLSHALVGLLVHDRGIIRDGNKIFNANDEEIGWVSSGTLTPTVGKAIGLGFVPVAESNLGHTLAVEVRSRKLAVEVVEIPFYKRAQ